MRTVLFSLLILFTSKPYSPLLSFLNSNIQSSEINTNKTGGILGIFVDPIVAGQIAHVDDVCQGITIVICLNGW